MKDELGQRMKEQYEHRTRFSVPRRTYTIIRLDGKAFHTYTRGLQKPFDNGLSQDIDEAIIAMMPQIQGAVFAYTQSDEISILLTDFATPNTDAWFDGNIQKMCSVSASIITAEFNKQRLLRQFNEYVKTGGNVDFNNPAYFDARVFTIPDPTEVMNYFIWRNQDCARNSVSMVAQSLFSHKELQGKSTTEMQEMMFKEHGINWSTYAQSKKNGRLIVKEMYVSEFNPTYHTVVADGMSIGGQGVVRSRWTVNPAWKFTENKELLRRMIPSYD